MATGIKKQLEEIFGDSGTSRYGGYFQDEKNTLWRDDTRAETVDEMRKTDGAVQAVLKGIKAPIISAEWEVFSYDDSPKGEEIREFVENNVFGMDRDWYEFLREALGFMDFGFYPFELIWEIRDGKIYLKDLAPRIPLSVMNWQIADKKLGITQIIRTDDFNKSTAEIPIDKLFVLTNDKEGDDITGQSILRAAYKHYKYKDILYRISGIAADRYGVGVPVIGLPDNYGDAEKESANELGENLRSSEKGYFTKPPGFTIEILTPNGNPQGAQIDNLIDHHNRMIMLSTLEQFLGLGGDGVGSFALSQDQSSFFLKHVEDKARYFASQFKTQVIKRLVDLNFGEQEWYPELKFSPLGTKNMKEQAEIINVLVMAGVLDASDPAIKKWIRPTFKLPELTDDQIEEQEAESEEVEEPETPEEEKELSQTNLSERPFKLTRKLTEQEKRIDFKALNEQFNATQSELEDELAQATSQEIDRFAEAARKKVDAGDIAGIGALSYMLYGKAKKAFENVIKKSYENGKKVASKEMGIKPPSTPLQDTQIMAMDANDMARQYVFEMENKSRDLVKDAVVAGAAAAAIASQVKLKARDEAARMIGNMSGTVVGQYVNRGRSKVFQDNLTEIQSLQRSEVLDDATCNICMSLDGRVIKADDPMSFMDIVHTHCRGLWVPVFVSDEEKPDVNGIPKTIADSFDLVDGRPTVNSYKQLKKPVNAANADVQDLIRKKMGV